jgi:YesN/AraC family two-component response regulator
MSKSKTSSSLLYVEDDPAIRALFSDVIRSSFPDVELHIAENGRIGLDLYKEHRPDIVVTDINMPIMDGIQMTRLIKDMKSEVTVIALSGNICDDYRSDALSAGITHYLNKPVRLQEFCLVIEDSINKTIH